MGFFSSGSSGSGSSGSSGSSGGSSFNSSCLSFNSGSCTFSPFNSSPSFVSRYDMAYNSLGGGSGSNSGSIGPFQYTPCFSSGSGNDEAARREAERQEEIKNSTVKTKTEETQEEKTPATTEAEETGSINKKDGTETTEAGTETADDSRITESSAPLSSQIDNTSKESKNCYEIPDYDLAGFCTTPFYLGENGNGGKEIENSVAAQARAKEGDTINGKELTKADIDWAKDKTNGTFTLGDLQRGNDLPEMPEIKYTSDLAEKQETPVQQEEKQPQENSQYEITTGQEGQMAQSEFAPQSPTMEDNEPTYQLDVGREGNLAGNEATERVSAEMPEETPQDVRTQKINKAWENSGVSAEDREKITRVYGDKLTAGQINFMAKTGVIDMTVKACDKISEIKELRAQNKEATEDQLMQLLTAVNKLRDALDDPKAKLYTRGMGNAFNKEDCKEEVALVSEVIDQMNELYPQAQSINDQIKAVNPGDEVQLVKKGLLTAENAGLQYQWQETMGGLYATKLAAGSRYMEQEEFTQTALDMAAQNAQVYGDEAGKVITENACVGLMTGNRSLTDMAFRSLGQSGLSTGGKGIAKLFTMVEEKGGKAFAEKLTSAVSEGVDALEAMKDTCLDEIARGKGKAEPYLNLAKGVGKILAGLAGALVTGGASLKLCLSGANDLANISWTWQNAKLGVQIEGMQTILDVMAKTIEMEPSGYFGEETVAGGIDSINRLSDSGAKGGSPYTQGKADVTGNGTSRYERKKKELEGLNYNTNTAQGFNEGIGSEEEMSGIYKNLLQNDGAARKFVSDLRAS